MARKLVIVKRSVEVVPIDTSNAHKGLGVWLHSFWNSALYGHEWSTKNRLLYPEAYKT
jgi:hypothetical protein